MFQPASVLSESVSSLVLQIYLEIAMIHKVPLDMYTHIHVYMYMYVFIKVCSCLLSTWRKDEFG